LILLFFLVSNPVEPRTSLCNRACKISMSVFPVSESSRKVPPMERSQSIWAVAILSTTFLTSIPLVSVRLTLLGSVAKYNTFYLLDGVVLVDPEYLKDRRVYGHVLAAFRYGREDLDVLGLTFRKDLYLASSQIFPPEDETAATRPLSRLQVSLVMSLYLLRVMS
jgi:hypothetical protein